MKTIEQKLEEIKKRRGAVKVELGKRYRFRRHCGQRLLQFKIFQKDLYVEDKLARCPDQCVCINPSCTFSYTDTGVDPI